MRANQNANPGTSIPRVAGIAFLVSLFSFLYYSQQKTLLFYGDAVAHINIARRVFDSLTPGPLQLGTVWLPLPHLLMIPFLWSKTMWQTGSGGSIPSMIAYVFGVVGIFRFVRGTLNAEPRTEPAAAAGAWAAAFAYGANPNLIYMQTTAMTESLYLALSVWAVVFFSEFLRELRKGDSQESLPRAPVSLTSCAWCLAGAELTRYDGWFLAGVMGSIFVVTVLRRWHSRVLRRAACVFLIGIAAVPVLWLAYNRTVYGNPLEFANGPYSAKAIEQRVGAPNPALHHAGIAAVYFLKSAQLNLANGNWGRFWLAGALLALALGAWKMPAQLGPVLLLGMPLPFYAFSIAYGSVPLHVYTWWPFATFNQRYGLQLLPMFAVLAGLLTAAAVVLRLGRRHTGKLAAAIFALILLSYASVWAASPLCLQEAQKNWDIRRNLNSAVQRTVELLPRNSLFLMDLGEHVGVMEQAGIPLRQVINNENHRPWKRPADPQGLWERALADPPRYVDFVIVFDGDAVDQGLNRSDLNLLTEIHASGQPRARVYSTHIAPNQSR
jgi:hypothetical protein